MNHRVDKFRRISSHIPYRTASKKKKILFLFFSLDKYNIGWYNHAVVSGCGADGSALPWGGRGRWFKSSHSDQIQIIRTFF